MKILVSGSVAYDRIMDFPGKFADHILPDKIHVLNVCFMINGLKENFGGTAGNIAYTLSLLGERPVILASAGRDFEPYKLWLAQNKISIDYISMIESELTAAAYITTDQSDNQITAFNPGAMKFSSASFDFDSIVPEETIAIVAPGNLDDMFNFVKIYKQKTINYIFDPGQSIPAWDKEKLNEMINGAYIFISNDYELQLTLEKASLQVSDLVNITEMVITTKGEYGSTVMFKENGGIKTIEIPAVKPRELNDPTGAGDAYRGGLIKGLLLPGANAEQAAKIGSVSASYSLEVYGTQNFHFTHEEFSKRFEEAFGKKAIL